MALMLILLMPIPTLPAIWLCNRMLARTERFALAELVFWTSGLSPALAWLGFFLSLYGPAVAQTGALPPLDGKWLALFLLPVLPMTLLTLVIAYWGARRGEGYRRL